MTKATDQGKTLLNFALKESGTRVTIMPTFATVVDDYGVTRRIVTCLKLIRTFASFAPIELRFDFNDDGVCHTVTETAYERGLVDYKQRTIQFPTLGQSKNMIRSLT